MSNNGTALVEMTDLSKHWGSTAVLTNANARIEPGITGLLGSNGAGKTTLLGMILGLHAPTGGRLSVLGLDPHKAGPEVRERIGYAPEHHNLPPDLAAHDFVRHMARIHGLPKQEANGRASDALWLVGLGEERMRPIGTMSTGQRQRVKLAQAFVHDPDLVLLDEPTDGLDPVQRDEMLSLITTLGKEHNINIVLSSHLLEEVERVADWVVMLNDGEVVIDGQVDEISGGEYGFDLFLEDGIDAVSAHLLGNGATINRDGNRLLVDSPQLDSEQLLDLIRDAVATEGAALRRLRAHRRTLEDVFLEAGQLPGGTP